MPNRVIRDAVLDSERYHACPVESRLLFFELLLCADDYGLVPLNEVYLRRHTTVCEGRTSAQIASFVLPLMDQDLIRAYDSDRGGRFGFLPRFDNRPQAKAPKWPVPPKSVDDGYIEAAQAKSRRNATGTGAPAPARPGTREAPNTPKANEINTLPNSDTVATMSRHAETETETETETEKQEKQLGPLLQKEAAEHQTAAAIATAKRPQAQQPAAQAAPAQASLIPPAPAAAKPPPRAEPAPLAPFTGTNDAAIPPRACVELSPAFDLPDSWGMDAMALGWKRHAILQESERFRQYWVAGIGKGKRRSLKGWRQSWSNWLARAERFNGGTQ